MSPTLSHSTRLRHCVGALCGAIVFFSALGCGKGGGGDIATIDGEPITTEEFQKYLESKPQVQIIDASGKPAMAPVAEPLGYQALREMIQQRIIRHLAKDEGVYPTDTDITADMEFQSRNDPNFMRMSSTMTTAQIKDQISLKLAVQNLVTRGITVTKEEVEKFIKDNPNRFVMPATADLEYIVVETEAEKGKVDVELKSGKKFAEVAVKYSKAPNARETLGKFPQRNVDTFRPELKALIEKTPELKTTDWVKNGAVWAKWYVEKKVPAKPVPIDDTIRENVRRTLALQRGGAANDIDKQLNDKLNKSKVEIKSPTYKPLWQQMMASMQAPPPQAPAAGGTPQVSGPAGTAKAPATTK